MTSRTGYGPLADKGCMDQAAPRAGKDLPSRLVPVVYAIPSPLGEGGRRPDEGEFSCAHRDLPLTPALSQERGKACSDRKSRKLVLPPRRPTHNALGFRGESVRENSHLFSTKVWRDVEDVTDTADHPQDTPVSADIPFPPTLRRESVRRRDAVRISPREELTPISRSGNSQRP